MLQIEINNESGAAIDENAVNILVNRTCEKFDIKDAQIGISIAGDERISVVHGQFMGDKSTTDVMSFNLSEPDDEEKTFEIIVNSDMAGRIAAAKGTSANSELMLYILHGLLHNIGFDDLCEQDFTKMHSTENTILQELGYGPVFGDAKFES